MKVLIIVSCLSICLGVGCICLNKEVTSQVELDRYIDEAARGGDNTRCIQWILVGSTYQLDLIKLLSISLQQNDSLMIQGYNGTLVDIHCIGGTSDMDLETVQPLSRFSSIVLDSLNFIDCPVPILVEEVSKVIISNCNFQHHRHGAVSLYNCTNVTITNCTFYDNDSEGYFSRKPYQGNSGGLTIGYNVLHPLIFDVISILITDCNFTLNRAIGSTSPNQATVSNIFPARGGGVIIISNTSTAVNCTITNNFFIDNYAQRAGGAIYIITQYANFHRYYCANNIFIRNRAPDSGALLFLPAIAENSNLSINFHIYNCTFDSNVGIIYAGAIVLNFFFAPNNNTVIVNNCTFRNNSATDYAGAVDVATLDFFSFKNAPPIRFKNCVFVNNLAPDAAAISIVYYNALMENVTFINHTGSTLRVIGGIVEFQGQLDFYSNNAVGFDGGAIYLLSYSQMLLHNDTHLEFVNNTGSFGAAVVVVTGNESISEGYARNFYNPLCFLQYNDSSTSPSDVNNSKISMMFSGNSAITGPAIFTNQLDLCSWYTTYPPYFKEPSEVLRWSFISYNNNTLIGDTTNTTTPVQTPAIKFILKNDSVMVYPGQLFQLRILPLDKQNSTAAILVEVLGNKNSDNSRIALSFNPSIRILQPNDLNFPTYYSVNTTEIFAEDINGTKHTTITIKSHLSEYVEHRETFKLIITPCPPGHRLQSTNANDEYVCQCDDDSDENIIKCQLKKKRIIIKEGLWAQHIDFGTINGILEYYQCPPSYCQCTRVDNGSNVCNSVYYYENDDLQCVCDRKGFLCGQCRDDKGVSALLNDCVSCGYVNILLIIALVIVDIVIITGILLSTHIKWSSWLYPLLYYLQVTPIVAQYFPVTFSTAQPYLHYISSAVSLYFPYDFCLYPGMSALASYTFRYIPLVVFIIALIIIFSLYRFNVKIFGQCRFSWNGLWLLIVLLFSNVVSTSVSILNCPRFKDHNGDVKLRWFVDGTVECFTGGHAALAVFALLIVALYVIVIVLVAVIARGKLRNLWTVSLRKVLQSSFTDLCEWWAPIELVIRLVFIMITMVFHRNLIPVLLCTIIHTTIYAYVQPFNNRWVNMLETTVLVDILLMLAISSTAMFKQSTLNSDHSFSIDHCGQVDTISEHAAMLIPFYYFPLIILLVIIASKIILNVKDIVTPYINRKRLKRNTMPRPKSVKMIKTTKHSIEVVIDENNQLIVNLVKTSNT